MLRSRKLVDTHNYTQKDWETLLIDKDSGIAWKSGDGQTEWTRFMNHTNHQHTNVSLYNSQHEPSTQKYGRFAAMVSSKPIEPGDELFWNYGNDFFPKDAPKLIPNYKAAQDDYALLHG